MTPNQECKSQFTRSFEPASLPLPAKIITITGHITWRIIIVNLVARKPLVQGPPTVQSPAGMIDNAFQRSRLPSEALGNTGRFSGDNSTDAQAQIGPSSLRKDEKRTPNHRNAQAPAQRVGPDEKHHQ